MPDRSTQVKRLQRATLEGCKRVGWKLVTGSASGPLAPPRSSLCLFSGAVQNPCAVENGGCMHDCRPDGTRAHCDCRVGFVLAEDRKTCQGKFAHPHQQRRRVFASVSREGCEPAFRVSVFCFCRVFFVADIDECQTEASNCAHGCHNTLGSYVCVCNAAYELGSDGKQCYSAFSVLKPPLLQPLL